MSMLKNYQLICLQNDLLKALPSYTHGANIKNAKSRFIQTEEALHCKFIRYGTKKTLNVLMFDIDDANETLEEFHEKIYKKIGIYPTFTLKTDRGYHFGLILNSVIFRTHFESNRKTSEALLATMVKEEITKRLNGDMNGSIRLIGIWRNPLMHEAIYTGEKYNILELAQMLDIAKPLAKNFNTPINPCNKNVNTSKMKINSNGKINDSIEAGFVQGNRNKYLFSMGYKIVYENRKKEATVAKELHQINSSHNNSLTEYEVNKISESIIKLIPTMYKPQHKSIRGKLSDEMWEKRIHGVRNRRSYAGYKTSLNRSISTATNVTESLIKLFEKGKTNPTNKEVTESSSISIRQYQRIKKKISKASVFFLWLKGNTRKIDIRAYVIPIVNRSWKKVETVKEIADYLKIENKPIAFMPPGQKSANYL